MAQYESMFRDLQASKCLAWLNVEFCFKEYDLPELQG
jgi:hypothetical protein